MANFLLSIFTLALILISLFLIFVVLLQRANTNAGLGTAFGGGITESTFGADAGNILTKCTIWATVSFFVISFGLYLGYIAEAGESFSEEGELPQLSAEEIPFQTSGSDDVTEALSSYEDSAASIGEDKDLEDSAVEEGPDIAPEIIGSDSAEEDNASNPE